jgi:hypothetical protein
MGKALRTYIRIFIILSSLLAVAGCGHDDPALDPDFLVRSFSVTGTVYDSSESLPGVPLEDVTISLSVFWYFNTERSGEPIFTAELRTGPDGRYEFYKSWVMTMQNVFYVLKVHDESLLRTRHFKPVEQELYLRPNNDAYDEITHSYTVKGNDFYLLPEAS